MISPSTDEELLDWLSGERPQLSSDDSGSGVHGRHKALPSASARLGRTEEDVSREAGLNRICTAYPHRSSTGAGLS